MKGDVWEAKTKDTHTLALVNYSCNGFNLRVKLGKGRRWRVSNKLVIEVDLPSRDITE